MEAGLRRGQSLQACVQAALVARSGVLVEDALLDGAVKGRSGGAVLRLSGLHVAGGERLAHGAQSGADAGAIGAIDLGAGNGLTGALQRRDMIGHNVCIILRCPDWGEIRCSGFGGWTQPECVRQSLAGTGDWHKALHLQW